MVQESADIPLGLGESGLQHYCFAQICSLKATISHMEKAELLLAVGSPGPVRYFPLSAALPFDQLCPAHAPQGSVP